MSRIERRLGELGIVLPPAPSPAASYVPVVRSGALAFVAGQVPMQSGGLLATGKVGEGVDLDAATACARVAALNVLAQLHRELGDLDRIRRVVKLTVFVAGTPGFTDHHLVANGASQLFGDVFDEAGRHARSSVGVAALPMDAPVEVDAIVEITP